MCFSAPKITPPPPPAQFQAMQAPKDFIDPRKQNQDRMRRRGFFASIFTGPSGIGSPPTVTGNSGGTTGG